MKLGTYYYPEQWPREQWARDLDNIHAMGLQIVHMGEFAWYSLEPAAGRFDMNWLAEAVEWHPSGILKSFCALPQPHRPSGSPSSPPRPCPSRTDLSGIWRGRHHSPTSPALREATRRIVTALAIASAITRR